MDQDKKIILERYLANISNLYESIAEWSNERSLMLVEEDIQIHEEDSGKYVAKKLVLRNKENEQIAEIQPIAAWIIGGDGRLDIEGRFDKQILIYIYKDRNKVMSSITASAGEEQSGVLKKSRPLYKGVDRDGWYWINDMRIGRAKVLDKELFFDLLDEVSDYGN